MSDLGNTQFFRVPQEQKLGVEEILEKVYEALAEKGYNPVNQIVGYIMSGDPTYITSYKNARSLIIKMENKMENGMRILGLDFGSKTVGVAVTDPLGYTAQGVEIIRRDSPNKLRKTLARIEQLVEQYNIEKIVLGYPVMLSGTEGERVKKTKEFGTMLERRTGLEIVFQDERLTTVEAYEIMDEAGIKKQDRYKYVDQIAATIILEDYINRIEKNT